MGGEQRLVDVGMRTLIALIFPVKSELSLSPEIVDMAANIGRLGREKEEEKRIV